MTRNLNVVYFLERIFFDAVAFGRLQEHSGRIRNWKEIKVRKMEEGK